MIRMTFEGPQLPWPTQALNCFVILKPSTALSYPMALVKPWTALSSYSSPPPGWTTGPSIHRSGSSCQAHQCNPKHEGKHQCSQSHQTKPMAEPNIKQYSTNQHLNQMFRNLIVGDTCCSKLHALTRPILPMVWAWATALHVMNLTSYILWHLFFTIVWHLVLCLGLPCAVSRQGLLTCQRGL